jgi:hypothetical protein
MQVPAGHRVQIGAGLPEGRQARDRNGQIHHAIADPAPQRQPRVAEQAQHSIVVRQHLSGEGLHAAGPSQGDQVLEQQRGDTAPVHAVGGGQRDLRGHPARVQLVTGHSRQFVAQQAEQCDHAGTVV